MKKESPVTALSPVAADGVHALVPPQAMTASARKRRAIYTITPDAPLLHVEFGYIDDLLDRWRTEGMTGMEPFGLEDPGYHGLNQLGWCEAAFSPCFETVLLEDRGECELVQDYAGRAVLFFKGRRSGFMPEYIDHPVKDMRTWEEKVKWRMNPQTPDRYADLPKRMAAARQAAARGEMITANLIGGYMYLRSLMGPEGVLYAFVDQPELIHDCMRTWLTLADAVTARHQQHVTLDEVYMAEDICYNAGPLISPDMMREFLLPYYQQLIANVRSRQIDRHRHLFIQIDTDGNVNDIIDVYRELGMEAMSPFEVASGCDVVKIGHRYPNLCLRGGIDKRVLAKGKDAIDRMIDYILPAMRRRGGYIPCCDHFVPLEVSYENYLHYRKRCLELGD
ncbi:MAG: hypothetical protein IT440_09090 [Phycisphaeraceae bacterium]|nr:hypothetical protein [Phycisphaeraceae bacterium]